jgi:AcrR family transcriptional regulator
MVTAILDAAARVVRTDGDDHLTTNRVAEVAGVSVGSLYQYFPNKAALLVALLERHDAEMWAVFTHHATAAIGRPFAEALPAVIDALFAAHHVDPELHRALVAHASHPAARAVLGATMCRAKSVVENLLRARTDQHRIDDVATAALVIVESVEALIHASIRALPPERARAVQRHAALLVLRYLEAPTAPAPSAGRG